MEEFDVIARIEELREVRGWSYYRLAKASGIPYSTLNTMLHKTNVPSVPSLMKICAGFGITLAQFFSESDETAVLRADQRECLRQWDLLDQKSKELALIYMKGLSDRQESKQS